MFVSVFVQFRLSPLLLDTGTALRLYAEANAGGPTAAASSRISPLQGSELQNATAEPVGLKDSVSAITKQFEQKAPFHKAKGMPLSLLSVILVFCKSL